MTNALLPDDRRDDALDLSIRDALIRYGSKDTAKLADAVILLMWVAGYKIVPINDSLPF